MKEGSLGRSSLDCGQDLGRGSSAGHAEFLGVGIDHLDLALSEVGGMAVGPRGSDSGVSEGVDTARTLVSLADTSPGLSSVHCRFSVPGVAESFIDEADCVGSASSDEAGFVVGRRGLHVVGSRRRW